jgi:hypothetical protein
LFEIKDPKKEYFYIDTSDYMTYSNKTLGEEYHCHHGPHADELLCQQQWLLACQFHYIMLAQKLGQNVTAAASSGASV